MKTLLASALTVTLALLVTNAEARPHKVCHFDHHHHRSCHWVH